MRRFRRPAIRGCARRSKRGGCSSCTPQAESFDFVSQGRQVVVTTPTASGKTLCYNLPVPIAS